MKKTIAIILSFCFFSILYAAIPQNGVNLVKVDKKKNFIETRFVLPEVKFKKVKTKGGEFVKIEAGDLGYSVTYGNAQLPTASFSIMIETASPEIEVVSFKKESIKLDAPVFPVQKPWPKSRRIEDRPFTVNRAYYQREKTDFKLVTKSGVYNIHGRRGITVTVHPFRYYPAKNLLVIYREVVLRIKNVSVITESKSPVFERVYSKVFLNYFKEGKDNKEKSASMGRILIITPQEYADTLSSFVSHKQAMGYQVDVFTLEDTGSTKEEIRDFVKQRYSLIDTRPDFLILVGDVNRIPAFRCSTEDKPYTDLYYTTVDGEDYFPDIACGRFSVSSAQELENIINKTVYMDDFIGNFDKKALFITADDNYQITEGTHNYVIDKYFEPASYNCEKIYYHTTGASTSGIADSINDGKIFVVYSGHGSPSSWYLNYDVSFTTNNVKTLLHNTIYPFVYSFACQTGEYEYSECFAETWIRVANGAVTFWGSSVYSYWNEDDILERDVFKAMFEDNVCQVGPMFNTGKIYLYNYYNGGGSTLRYFQQYNLFGDPSVYVKPYKPVSMGQLFLDKEAVSCEGSVEIEVWDSDLTSDTVDVTITNLASNSAETVVLNKIAEGKYSASVSLSGLFGEGSAIFKVEYLDSHYGDNGENTLEKQLYLDCDSPRPTFLKAVNMGESANISLVLSEECSEGTLTVYTDNGKAVSQFNLDRSSSGVFTVSNLDSGKLYYADISLTDYTGNTFTQSGIRLFKACSTSALFENSCDDDDGTFSYETVTVNEEEKPEWVIKNSSYAVSNGLCWYGEEWDFYHESTLTFGPVHIPDNGFLSFYHTFYLEDTYDYGVVEISTDGGATFKDLGALMVENGYNGSVEVADDKYIPAYTGGSFGDMQKVIISLYPYRGQDVYIRFRLYCDASVAMDNGGWYIDNIKIEQISGKEYTSTLVNLNPDTVISILTAEDNTLNFSLYNSRGNVVAEKSINLASYQAYHSKLSDIFEEADLNNAPFTLVCNSLKNAGLYQMDDFADSRGEMRNWTEGCKYDGIAAVVPHIAPEIWYWDTFVQVAGKGGENSDFALSYLPLNALSFMGEGCEPFSSKEFDVIDSVFQNSWPNFKVGMADIYSVSGANLLPFCATEVFQVKDKDNSARLTLEQERANTLYVAHVDNSDYWWTGIALVNTSPTLTAIVDIYPYTKDGIALSPVRVFIDPGEKYAFVTKEIFPLNSAWFVIKSNTNLIGYELFGTMNRKLLTGLDLISRPSVEVLLPVVNCTDDWYGITIVNPNAVENTVQVEGYLNGEKVFDTELNLGGFEKWVGLLSDLYKGDVDMVRVYSLKGIVSFCLEGNGHDDSTMTRLGGVTGFVPY